MHRYMEKFSDKKSQPCFSIGQDQRFNMKRSMTGAGKLGPGAYRVDRDFPENYAYETDVTFNSKCKDPAPRYTFNVDERMARDGCLKGLSQMFGKRNPLGPGHYDAPSMESRVNKRVSVKYTIPRAKETQEAIRERKVTSTTPPAGSYEPQSKFDEIDREKTKVIKKLAEKHGRESWAAPSFSHIFSAMKPLRGPPPGDMSVGHGHGSAPNLHKTEAPPPKEADAA